MERRLRATVPSWNGLGLAQVGVCAWRLEGARAAKGPSKTLFELRGRRGGPGELLAPQSTPCGKRKGVRMPEHPDPSMVTIFDTLAPGTLQRFSYLVQLPQEVLRPSPVGFASSTELREFR